MLETSHRLPGWSAPLFRDGPHYRYIAIHGGRGSSKTATVARYIVHRCMHSGKPIRAIVARDFAKYLPESAMEAIQIAIRTWMPEHENEWETRSGVTKHLPTGSEIMYSGLELIGESFKGWENVSILWIEEAQTLKENTFNIIYPTIRAEDSQIILTWNPKERSEVAWKRFVLTERDDTLVFRVNYYDNPYLPDVIRKDIEQDAIHAPQTWQHIWLGEPDDEAAESKVLAYSTLLACVEAYESYADESKTPVDVGLDIADGGADMNSLVVRKGPSVVFRDEWRSLKAGHLTPTAARAANIANEHAAWRLVYDRTGVGSPILGSFSEMDWLDFPVRGVSFGEKPGGEDRMYDRRRTNSEAFMRRNSQMAFALRLRANRTMRLLAGEGIDPEDCLFINPQILKAEHFLADLSRPAWRMNTHGRIEIDKRDGEEKSPDAFDALCLAFARDSDNGLRARR